MRRIRDFLLINHCGLRWDNDFKRCGWFVPLPLYDMYTSKRIQWPISYKVVMGEGGLFGAFWAKHMDYLTIALLMIYVEVTGTW